MSYDINKLTKLGHLKSLATKIKEDYATKAELQAIEIPEYSVVKQGTAESGFLSTYYLTKDGAQVGEKINIPKDFLVNSADIKTVETADTPYEGAQVGDLYIDFVINSKSADDTASHVYLPVNELVDAYTGGNGIEVSAQNLISAKIDTANANGLGVTAAGFKLDVATASTAGAMSAADKAKLDGIAEGANNYTHPAHTAHESGLYKVTVDAQGHVSGAEAATKEDITGLGIPAQDTTYQKATAEADGLMSKEHFAKVEGVAAGATKVEASTTPGNIKINGSETPVVTIATDGEVAEMLAEVFPTA
jgi:hypothetical protein